MVALRISSGPGALFFILFLLKLPLALARIVNRTIDDQYGDSVTQQRVTYLPKTSVRQYDVGNICRICPLQPDISRAFKGKYTIATYSGIQLGPVSITMKFKGTAVFVFFILLNDAPDGITSLTLANFTLDGTKPVLFQHAPDLTRRDIGYNQLVYSKQDLINAEHTLVISTSGVETHGDVIFDYVIYSYDDDAPLLPLPLVPDSTLGLDTPDTKNCLPVGRIIGGLIGGAAFLLLVAFLLLFCRRRRASRHHRSETEGTIVTPFNSQPTLVPFLSTSENQQGCIKNSSGALKHQISPSSRGDRRGPYESYIDPNANDSESSTSLLSGSPPQYRDRGAHNPFTDRGPIPSPDTALGVSWTTVTSANNSDGKEGVDAISVEAIRREIDDSLRAVQQEAVHLRSDRRGEMSMAQMREQLRVMTEQIRHLREQRRSAWPQALSDDPPRYTLNVALKHSEPTAAPPN